MGASRVECPFDCETWGLNNGYKQLLFCFQCSTMENRTIRLEKGEVMYCPRCGFSTPIPRLDKLFLAHTQCWDADGEPIFNWHDFNLLAERGVEIINTHRVKGLNAKMYPMKAIIKKYGRDYFSDTIAYQIAYALYKGYDKIKIYGADMHTYGEYATEKAGLEYWLGRAEQAGIELFIPKQSSLLKTSMDVRYGVNQNIQCAIVDEKGKKRVIKRKLNRKPFEKPMIGLEVINVPDM